MFHFVRRLDWLCGPLRNTLWLWITVAANFTCQAQDQPTWRHDFGRPIEWGKLYEEHGLYFAYGQNELTLFDLQTREVVWSQVLVGAAQENMDLDDDFPMLGIGGLNSTKVSSSGKRSGDKDRYVLLSLFTGDVLLDTDTYDLDVIAESYLYFDAECLLIKGKHQDRRVLALARFGVPGLQWRVPEPARLKKITLNSKFESRPQVGRNHLVFIYADSLFGMDLNNGAVLWKESAGTSLAAKLGKASEKYLVPRPTETELPGEDTFYLVEWADSIYSLRRYGMASKKEPLAAINLGTNYNFNFSGKDLLIRTGSNFNYFDPATGVVKWENPPDLTDHVRRVYRLEDGYLVWLTKSDAAGNTSSNSLHWVKPDLSMPWLAPHVVNGASLKLFRKVGEQLLYATDLEVGIIDFASGKNLVRMPLALPGIYTVDQERGDMLVLQGNELFRLSGTTAKLQKVVGKIEFSGDNESPSQVRIVEGGYAVSSDRNLWLISREGEVRYKKYVKEPGISAKTKKVVLMVGGAVAGRVLNDELGDLSRIAYDAGLIDATNASTNITLSAFGGSAGSALVGAAQMERFVKGKSLKRKMTSAGTFNHLWLVADKLSKDKFGLRVIDVNKGEQVHEVWLDDEKDFTYNLLYSEQGLLIRDHNAICFYSL
jgi:outer membrane protein assembly factor BamB